MERVQNCYVKLPGRSDKVSPNDARQGRRLDIMRASKIRGGHGLGQAGSLAEGDLFSLSLPINSIPHGCVVKHPLEDLGAMSTTATSTTTVCFYLCSVVSLQTLTQ